jgi:sphingomyelin phosphodiesterase acid-like 3
MKIKLKNIITTSIMLLLLVCHQTSYASDAHGYENFLTVADIHFDPFAACGDSTPCLLIQQLENAPVSAWPGLLENSASGATPQYHQDTDYILLNSTLTALQVTAEKSHAQFIIVLGDSITHKFPEKYQRYTTGKSQQDYQQFVKKAESFVASELRKKFPTTDIYFSVGNNDSYHEDYVTKPGGDFFNDMSKEWGASIHNQIAREQMQHDFTTAGYYAVDIPQQRSLRLVVLNSNLFSAIAPNMAADAATQFAWLEQQLQQARDQNQRTLIVMHIPVGVDVFSTLKKLSTPIVEMWRPDYTQRFNQDLQEYGETISGILSGHTHSDTLQVIELQNGHHIPFITTPSVSPIFGNNPGFKVFSYDTHTMNLEDYSTYYASLLALDWRQEYDFDTIYQTDNIQRPLGDAIENLPTTGKLALAYQLYYDTSSNTAPIHHSYDPYYRCQLKVITAADYQTCLVKR